MPHFNQDNINTLLGAYRSNLRAGKARVDFSQPCWVRGAIASALSIKTWDFTAELFSSRTLARFDTFFNVPQETGWRKPSVDEFAWAIQNFINRRAQPWKSYENVMIAETMIAGEENADAPFAGDEMLNALEAREEEEIEESLVVNGELDDMDQVTIEAGARRPSPFKRL